MRSAWGMAAVAATLMAAGALASAVSPAAPVAGPAPGPGPDRACLALLRARHIDFMEWPTRGVRTPIRLIGALGPLRLIVREGRAPGLQPVMDCELGRALLDASRLFEGMGIRDLIYSGIYQYRTRRGSTKLSEHAHGLAIDVHAFVTGDGTMYVVERDFEKGVGVWAVTEQETCVGTPSKPAGAFLRRLACGLRASSAFREVITSDDNADHYNHFHLEAFPDALSRTKAILGRREGVVDD